MLRIVYVAPLPVGAIDSHARSALSLGKSKFIYLAIGATAPQHRGMFTPSLEILSPRRALVLSGLCGLLLCAHPASAASTARMSVNNSAAQGNADSVACSISADGRYVAFVSGAKNLVPGDTNGKNDIFVRDRETNTISRVSVNSSGGQGNDDSDLPSISGDGRYVAFESYATNLVPNDKNFRPDVFVHDRTSNTTTRISVSTAGVPSTDFSGGARISADGHFVAFYSAANKLVANDTNSSYDVFVRDLQANTTTRLSVSSAGLEGEQGSGGHIDISGDGRYIVFESAAENLVTGDNNSRTDIFVRDRTTSTTTRVSVNTGGVQANNDCFEPRITSDGRYVTFRTIASNLVTGDTGGHNDVFVRDRQTSATTRVSLTPAGGQINGDAVTPAISNDGRYVAYETNATNVVSGDTNGVHDIFVRDCQTNTNWRASRANDGAQSDLSCFSPSISGNGRYVAFESASGNLVPSDTLGFSDIFVRDRAGDGYTVPSPPKDVSVTPSTASDPVNSARVFTTVFSDPDGFANIQTVAFRVGLGPSSNTSAQTLFCRYTSADGHLTILNDAGTTFVGGFAPGSANLIQNSQGILHCAQTTVTKSGNAITVNWSVSGKPGFVGAKPLALRVVDNTGLSDGLENFGTWTITASSPNDGLTSSDAQGNAVTLHFNRPLQSNGSPFSVTVNGEGVHVQTAQFEGATVTLQLGIALQPDDSVGVAWDNLADADGNSLSGRVGIAVP
jgi:hypothetical protein